MMEGNTQDVRFVLLNPPPAGEEFEFDFNVALSTLDVEAKGELNYILCVHLFSMWFACSSLIIHAHVH